MNLDAFTGLMDEAQLPDPLPESPMPLARQWLDEAVASAHQPNPTAMTLATIGPDGVPGARIVLCRDLRVEDGCAVFYTNYDGDKGQALEANPIAALCFHWDHTERQVRLTGPVTRSPAAESDAYFATRAWESRLGAWASRQSRPLESRQQLLEQVVDAITTLKLDVGALMTRGREVVIPRPPHWGGYRVWASSVELWVGGKGRLHDRARWTRPLARETTTEGEVYRGGAWSGTRLQP